MSLTRTVFASLVLLCFGCSDDPLGMSPPTEQSSGGAGDDSEELDQRRREATGGQSSPSVGGTTGSGGGGDPLGDGSVGGSIGGSAGGGVGGEGGQTDVGVGCGPEVSVADFPLMLDTTAEENSWVGSCGGKGRDITRSFVAPADGDYTFNTFGAAVDTILYVLDGLCEGEELACVDDTPVSDVLRSRVTVSLVAGQEITLVVDALWSTPTASTILALFRSVWDRAMGNRCANASGSAPTSARAIPTH